MEHAEKGPWIRQAYEQDLAAIKSLDASAFPPGRPDREPAHPGELENGVNHGQIVLLVEGSQVLGMMQYEDIGNDYFYLVALAVDPEFQGRRAGTLLLDHFLKIARERPEGTSVMTVTSPLNVPMLKLLMRNGFIGRTVIPGYFGPKKDRVYCQYSPPREPVEPSERVLVPVDSTDAMIKQVTVHNRILTGVVQSVSGEFFELSPARVSG